MIVDNYFKVGGRFFFFRNTAEGAVKAHAAASAFAGETGQTLCHFADPAGIPLYHRADYRSIRESAEAIKKDCKCRGQCQRCEALTFNVQSARYTYVHSGESRLIGEGL